MNPTDPEPPDPVIPGHPDGVPIKQPPPPAPPDGGGDAATAAGNGTEIVGGVLEGAGCCLDGCAGCSLAVLATLFTAAAAVARTKDFMITLPNSPDYARLMGKNEPATARLREQKTTSCSAAAPLAVPQRHGS